MHVFLLRKFHDHTAKSSRRSCVRAGIDWQRMTTAIYFGILRGISLDIAPTSNVYCNKMIRYRNVSLRISL